MSDLFYEAGDDSNNLAAAISVAERISSQKYRLSKINDLEVSKEEIEYMRRIMEDAKTTIDNIGGQAN